MSHRADAVLARAVPEGIKVKTFVADLKESFEGLPKKSYACEMTRTNKGICYSPGEPADSAYDTALKKVRFYATRKGKGALMSDGVSAASSAAF